MNTVNVCRPASIEFLQAGMYVADDIFDFTATNLLLPAGRTLDDALIYRLKRFNKMRECIYVSERTYNRMRKGTEQGGELITSGSRYEKTTGYIDIMNNTTDLMRQIADTNDLPKEAVYSVSEEVAHRLRIIKTDVVFDIINALAPVDEYLQRHVVNVGMLNGLMGQWLGFSNDEVNKLILTGLIHDCGKAIIPLEILNAPRGLTTVEFEVMKTHPLFSFELIKDLPNEIRLGALHHHEKYSGVGYPNKLIGNSVPLYARITAISDVYDSMVSRRVYKGPSSPFAVLSKMKKLGGASLDPLMVRVFIERLPEELIGKPALLSDGRVGYIKASDPGDIEFPFVNINGIVFKTSKDLRLVSMLIP